MMGFVSCCVVDYFDTCGSGYSTADPKVKQRVEENVMKLERLVIIISIKI